MAECRPAFRIETERLVLREWRETDLDDLYRLCINPAVMRFLGPLQSRSEVASGLARLRGYQITFGYSFWPVERKADSLFLGFCGLKPGAEGTPIEGGLEMGWRIRPECWGGGYVREAAEAGLAWAWANTPAPEVVAITNMQNTRSWGLMERLGMTRDPADDFDYPGRAEDDPLRRHIIYRIRRPS